MILQLHNISLSLTPSEIVKGLDNKEQLSLFAELFETLKKCEIKELLKTYEFELIEVKD